MGFTRVDCLGLFGLLLGSNMPTSRSQVEELRIMLPLYAEPTSDYWSGVVDAVAQFPSSSITTIINPASGPGVNQSLDYVNGMSNLTTAGAEILCYVATGFGTREVVDVVNDIDTYEALYPGMCEGIFLDEGPTAAANISKYEQYYAYVQTIMPFSTVVLNPGRKTDGLFYSIGNGVSSNGTLAREIVIVSCESSYEQTEICALPVDSIGIPFPSDNTTNRYQNSLLIHGAQFDSLNETEIFIIADQAYCLNWGYIYVTDDTLPNPWDERPSYLPTLIQAVEAAPFMSCPSLNLTNAPTPSPAVTPSIAPIGLPSRTPVAMPTTAPVQPPTEHPVHQKIPSDAWIEAQEQTHVSFVVTGYDDRAYEDNGCYQTGCKPEYTRDHDLSYESRWSCSTKIDGVDECSITYMFSEPQTVRALRIDFHKGDLRTREFMVIGEGRNHQIRLSSDFSYGPEDFLVDFYTSYITILSTPLEDPEEWFSLTEVEILVQEGKEVRYTDNMVSVSATAYDTRIDSGCGGGGCAPSNTRIGEFDDHTRRWSCQNALVGWGRCRLMYDFARPVYLSTIRFSFYKGNEHVRHLTVYINGAKFGYHTTSWDSLALEDFTVCVNHVSSVDIVARDFGAEEWISINNVDFYVL